jgi:prepilin-type N-terminal cleavage/methylation domain-containing protein
MPKRRSHLGFTLSELLIAIGVLGLIAAFTIPKVLVSTSQTVNSALLKETIHDVAIVAQESALNEGINLDTASLSTYFKNKYNVAKHCPSDAVAQGCISPSYSYDNGTTWNINEAAVVLQNGVVVFFYAGWTAGGGDEPPTIIIDVNGEKGPNLLTTGAVGERDIVRLSANFSPQLTPASNDYCPSVIMQPGSVMPWCGMAEYRERYADLFAH